MQRRCYYDHRLLSLFAKNSYNNLIFRNTNTMKVPGFILSHTNIREIKLWHFYLLIAGWSAAYTAMNVSVILFLNEALGNIFFAGLALTIGCVCSMFFDGVFSHLQKILTPRTLFLSSIMVMISAVLLFTVAFNTPMVFLAAILFSIAYDLCDITAVSYVLSKSLPAEYGQNLSYKQLAQGTGMIVGLLISAIVLWASYFVGETAAAILINTGQILDAKFKADFISALFVVKLMMLVLLTILWMIAFILFDREHDLSRESILVSIQDVEAETMKGLRKTSATIVRNIPLINKKKEAHDIEMISTEFKEEFHAKIILQELGSAIKDLLLVVKKRKTTTPLNWSLVVLCIFSYWDTFLGTFMPIFFTEILRNQESWLKSLPGSILMFIFIIPVLGLLPFIGKWGDRHGRHPLIITGIAITMISTFLIGILNPKMFLIIFIAGFGISFGYLFVMSAVRADTADKLTEFLAIEKNLEKIDTNASSGPMMLINNIGNIVGTLVGGALITLLGFQGLFLMFSLILLVIIVLTFRKYTKITGYTYVFQSPVSLQKIDNNTVLPPPSQFS